MKCVRTLVLAPILSCIFVSVTIPRAACPAPQPDTNEEATDAELTADQKEEAKRHFVAGSKRFDEGRYREAIDHFEVGYGIAGSPEFLYNIGRCHEELGESDEAIEYYERYLRLEPNAADAKEARDRIDRLESVDTETATVEPDGTGEREQAEWLSGMRLGAASGASFILAGEWEGTRVPLDLIVHYPMSDWLFLTAIVEFGSYLEQSVTKVAAGKAKSQLGLFAGVSALLDLGQRLDLLGRIGVLPTGVFRRNHQTAFWLDFEAGVGIAIWIFHGWSVTVEAVGGLGPVFIADARVGDPWSQGDGTAPTADVGGRIGFFYAFE